MNEEFFHYLWKFRLLDRDLFSENGEQIVVIHPGEHNHDSGPDFFNARVRLGNTTWVGNVEIHVNSSDWYKHNHQKDRAYDNVILHVVYENDCVVTDVTGRNLTTLSVKGRFPESILLRYGDFLKSHRWIPCEHLVPGIDSFHFLQWAPGLALDFHAEKLERFHECLTNCNYDWDECFYRQLSRSFGFMKNSLPFELLSKSLNWKILKKYTANLFQIEALLFGQAGLLLASFHDEYPKQLKKEYEFLRQKHSLTPVDPVAWKFLRLRPSNFPTIRIAELASLLHHQQDLFSGILKADSTNAIRKYFIADASAYWSTHFIFDKPSPEQVKSVGSSSIDLLILNFVVPFLFFFGEVKKIDPLKEKGITFLEQLQGEVNSGILRWRMLGFPASNALQTQALMQLKRGYCDPKKCLDCRIGAILLNDNRNSGEKSSIIRN